MWKLKWKNNNDFIILCFKSRKLFSKLLLFWWECKTWNNKCLEINNAKFVSFDKSIYSYKEYSYYSIESNQIKHSYVIINSKVFKNEKSTFKANILFY